MVLVCSWEETRSDFPFRLTQQLGDSDEEVRREGGRPGEGCRLRSPPATKFRDPVAAAQRASGNGEEASTGCRKEKEKEGAHPLTHALQKGKRRLRARTWVRKAGLLHSHCKNRFYPQ